MLQVIQHLSTGQVEINDVPSPAVAPNTVLVRNHSSLISSGTERMLLNFGRASYLAKARQHPDKVKQVLQKIRTDGLWPTVSAVRNKLDQPVPSGYSCAGEVIAVGAGISDLKIGDRVAGNGYHAVVARMPRNLCVKVPEGVTYDEAAFTVVAAIPLQGIRLAQPSLGESFAVIGLGLVGLLCAQLLRAHGCKVIGVDFDTNRLRLAQQFGAEIVNLSLHEDAVMAAQQFSRGRGVDGVIVCAGGTSSDMINQAADMCRVRGRVIQVGVTGLQLDRERFFRKEILLQVSNSTGPGKSDPAYEERGIDYPIGFVRWTQQRNLEAVLDMMADGRIDVKPLISHRFTINDAKEAYGMVGSGTSSLGVLLQYPTGDTSAEEAVREATVRVVPRSGARAYAKLPKPTDAIVAFVGAGNYATGVLIPAFQAAGARMKVVASSGGISGAYAGRKFGFEQTTTDTEAIFADPAVTAVVITTRHDSHAALTCKALQAGKHAFVEKPLAMTLSDLSDIEQAYAEATSKADKRGCHQTPILMVGFNRRFAPHVYKIRSLLKSVREPKAFVMTVNAGALPGSHWAQDIEVGGGRILGEACHFIDLLRFLADSPIVSHASSVLDGGCGDTATIQLDFADGSIGTVHYFTNGSKAYPKERLEVFAGSRILQLDNFLRLTGYAWPDFRKMNLWQQDKGHKACAAAFVHAIERSGASPIPFDQLLEVSRVTVEIAQGVLTRIGLVLHASPGRDLRHSRP